MEMLLLQLLNNILVKMNMNNLKVTSKKAALQISFGWLFAIIVGGFILFLAIFGVTKLIGQEQTIIGAKTSKEIGILLNPLETSFETGKTAAFSLPAETRIYNRCNNFGTFGRQIIQVAQKSFDKWTETDVDVGFSNKYIFSEKYVEGKLFYLFSKPFVFPFKVTDLIYMTSSKDTYCFSNAPNEIEREIEDLNQKNLITNCSSSKEMIKVCFEGGSDCDIEVNYGMGSVTKNGQKSYFEGDALMYAAIFADKEVYECQLKRLMQRISQLSRLYNDKASFISDTGCGSNLNLMGLINSANSLTNSANLNSINYLVEEIKDKNEENSECRLW